MKSPFKRSKNRRTNDARVTLADVETDEGVDERRQWKRGRAEGGGGGAVFVEEIGRGGGGGVEAWASSKFDSCVLFLLPHSFLSVGMFRGDA